jgi:tetratricopeptide (TPR) repeat protein
MRTKAELAPERNHCVRQIAWFETPLRIVSLLLFGIAAASGQIYTAKIVVEGDIPTPKAPTVTAKLSNRLVAMCALNVFGNGTVEYAINWRSREYDVHDADSCPVTIKLAGYRTMDATLRSGAVIVLKRIGDHEGSMVSMTSLNAPKEAKKAYEKGEAAMSESKWPAAQKNFEKAVAVYPQYAQAWCDLGEALHSQAQSKEARAAWERALQADPKYLKTYLQSARLALEERRLQDALEITDRAILQNPIEFPGIYFFNAVANFNLKQLEAAEKSVRQAIEHDSAHEIPRAESLLGSILANRGDLTGAITQFKKYLEHSPKAPDADNVRQQIASLERRMADAR